MSNLPRLSILATEFFVRQTRTRFPFRYGIASMTVAQTSKSAVSQVSKLADRPMVRRARAIRRVADWEIGDTAGLETCATIRLHTRFPLTPAFSPSEVLG